MKKYISVLFAAVMTISCFTACSSHDSESSKSEATSQTETTSEVEESSDSKSLQIVTTIFPEYDWVKNILGDEISHADITMLLDNGVDLHSYQPTAEDIMKVSTCDLFLYVGGESDAWVEDALKNATNKDMKVINLLDVLKDTIKTEEAVPGMQAEEGHNHGVSDFSNSDVQERSLSDWNGDWQSVYPYVLDGTLDPVMEKKAESGNKTAEEYKKSYTASYETDIENISIDDNTITYTRKDGTSTATYDSRGFYIREKDDGSKQVRYKYQKVSGDADAPTYIVFSDHNISSAEPEHFHLYFGEDGFDKLVEEGTHFPTFYPASLTGDEIADEMLEHEEKEYDEHVWLSLKNTKTLCSAISNTLQELDPENKDIYAKNASSYIEKISTLDSEYKDVVNQATCKTLLFGDRFPFRYLVDDYGLSYYAAFAGCSAETEASFETITFLANKIDELGLKHIMTIEKSDQKIAKTIIENTAEKNQDILTLDSMQSTTSDDVANGVTYLSVMENNLKVLQKALQ